MMVYVGPAVSRTEYFETDTQLYRYKICHNVVTYNKLENTLESRKIFSEHTSFTCRITLKGNNYTFKKKKLKWALKTKSNNINYIHRTITITHWCVYILKFVD